jgi:O-antigen ligase
MSRSQWSSILFSVYLISTLISMAAMSLGLVFLVAALIVAKPNVKALRARLCGSAWVRAYVWMSAALFLACLASLMGATISPPTIGATTIHVRWPQDLLKAWYFLLPLLNLSVLLALDEKDREKPIRAWLWATMVLSVIGFFQHFTGWPRPQLIPFDPHGRYHVTLFLGHHLSVASVFIFPVFFALDRFWLRRKEKSARLDGAVFLLGALALALTFARSVWIALPVTILVWAALRLSRKALLGCAVSILAACALLVTISSAVRTRVIEQAQFGVQDRFDLWEANWHFFKMRPLIGLGWRKASDLSGAYVRMMHPEYKYIFAGHAHNNLIEMAASTGIFGVVTWLAWCCFVFFGVFRLARQKLPAAGAGGLVAAWIAFHINGLTQVNFWEGKVDHQIMWAVALGGYLIMREKGQVSTLDPGKPTC